MQTLLSELPLSEKQQMLEEDSKSTRSNKCSNFFISYEHCNYNAPSSIAKATNTFLALAGSSIVR